MTARIANRGELRPDEREARIGIAYGLAAYLFWGLGPIYFKAVATVSPIEVLAHRVAFGALLLVLWLWLRGRIAELVTALRDRATLLRLLLTTTLIGFNWFFFIYAVVRDQVLQASLGYYINPLVNVLLGALVLGERLRPAQWAAVGLAAMGVGYLTYTFGGPPTLALLLAGTFAAYGLLRKTARVEAVAGLAVETLLLWPLAVAALVVMAMQDTLSFGQVSRGIDVLLACAGLVTVLPLLWFTHAVRRLRLATVGLLQYFAPTLHFLLAVSVYGEHFTHGHAVAFTCIWTALIIYSADTWRARRTHGGRTA